MKKNNTLKIIPSACHNFPQMNMSSTYNFIGTGIHKSSTEIVPVIFIRIRSITETSTYNCLAKKILHL